MTEPAFVSVFLCFFFFNDTATTEIYTLSLHDALPICRRRWRRLGSADHRSGGALGPGPAHRLTCTAPRRDRKSTRLNSSHVEISYAVFCLKKKNINCEDKQYAATNRVNL